MMTRASKELSKRIKEPSPSKHRHRCKGGVKWTDKMATLWWSIHVSRAKHLRAGDKSPHELRKVQERRRAARVAATAKA